jgi:hypothetical protein
MKRVISSVAVLAALLAAGTPAFAQQNTKVAVVVSAPSAIGVLIPASDSVAIRPEFSFNKSSTENTSGTLTTKFDSWQVGAAVSALFYTGKPDAFRTYWTPRFSVNHQNSNSTGNNVYSASGSFGAEYAVGSRFKVFGELGASYAWQHADTTTLTSLGSTVTSSSKSRSFGTRSVIGVGFTF